MTTDKLDDPFSVGQLIGILIVLTFIERNNGIPKDFLDQLKSACAEKSAAFLDQPTEDIFLMVDSLVKNIGDI